MRSVCIATLMLVFASSATANLPPPSGAPARAWFVGAWSFDGSCASGDGMVLARDGKASYDERGQGLWAAAENGQRLVLIVEDISEEADRRTEAELVEFRVVARQRYSMTMKRLSDGATINAKRCAGQ